MKSENCFPLDKISELPKIGLPKWEQTQGGWRGSNYRYVRLTYERATGPHSTWAKFSHTAKSGKLVFDVMQKNGAKTRYGGQTYIERDRIICVTPARIGPDNRLEEGNP